MTHTQKSTFHALINFHGKHDQNSPLATKRTLEWVIYNVKGYLNPRWRLVTIDLHSKLCMAMCCVLETGLTRNFAADLSLQIFNNH